MASQEQYSTNLGISSLPEFSQKDFPELYVDALKLRGALRTLQGALDRYTGVLPIDQQYWSTQGVNSVRLQNLSPVYAIAGEDIVAGAIVSFYDVSGVLTAQNANATAAGKPARAFASGIVATGSYGQFILCGINPYIGGLTNGATYYLSNTNGLIAPAAGTILQRIGFAVGTSKLYFNPDLV